MRTTKPATIAASKNDNATAGPACSAATTPGNVKLQLIQSYQHLMQENLERVMYVLNDHLYFDRLWDLLFELNFEKLAIIMNLHLLNILSYKISLLSLEYLLY